MRPHRSRGLGLIELLLVLGVATAAMAAVYGLYRVVAGNNRQDVAVGWVEDTATRVTQAYASAPNYRHLTQETAMAEGLFGRETFVEEGRAVGPWGGEARLGPVPAVIDGQSIEDAAFRLTLADVPGDLCTPLVSSLASSNAQLAVNGQGVGRGMDLDVGQAASYCDQAPAEITLTFVRADAHSGLQACEPPSGPQQREVPCDAPGQTGARVEQRDGHCMGAYGEVSWGPWSIVESHCVPCPADETRTTGCAAGEYGAVSQTRSFDCEANEWGPWQTTGSTCAPCPPDETRIVPCPKGQTGVHRERRTFYCSTGTWSNWVTQSNTCGMAGI